MIDDKMANDVQHPDHYTWKGTECKTIIESMTKGLDGQDAYYVGNIIKYLYRTIENWSSALVAAAARRTGYRQR